MARVKYKKKSKRTGKYKSKLEQIIARKLGKKAEYETTVLQYSMPKRYTPDFVLVKPDASRIYIEVKGYFRYEDQAKMKAVKACHPQLDIRMFFPRDNKVGASGMLNSEWCQKYGFPYTIGTIPDSWLE